MGSYFFAYAAPAMDATEQKLGSSRCSPGFLPVPLLAQSEIRLALAGHGDRLGLVLGALVPGGDRIASVGNIFNLVTSGLVSDGKVWGGGYHDVSRHFGMDIAQQRHGARVVELEILLLPLRPSAEVVRQLLVAADRDPKSVVRDRVTVQEFDGCALLNSHETGLKLQAFLIHDRLLGRTGEDLACDGLDVNHRLTVDARNFSTHCSCTGRSTECEQQCSDDYQISFHDLSLKSKCGGSNASPFLVDKLQIGDGRIGAERLGDLVPAGIENGLLWPNLIFECGLDVGVDEKLDSGSDAVASCGQRRHSSPEAIDPVSARLDHVVAHDSHHPWEQHVVGLQKPSAECRGHPTDEAVGPLTGGGERQKVLVVTI